MCQQASDVTETKAARYALAEKCVAGIEFLLSLFRAAFGSTRVNRTRKLAGCLLCKKRTREQNLPGRFGCWALEDNIN